MVGLPFRSVVGFGLACGLVRWRLRVSRHAWTGRVVVVVFPSRPVASAFASSFGRVCGAGFCAVRPVSFGSATGFAVSVPVA